MSRRPARKAAAGALVLALVALLPSPTQAAERPERPRRSETLERLRAKYPDFRFRLDVDGGDPGMTGAMEFAAVPEGPALTGSALAVAAFPTDPALRRLHAGHLLRHLGFGPTPAEVDRAVKLTPARVVDAQLRVRGTQGCRALPKVDAKNRYNDWERQKRWYARMVCAQGQLNEKMTLIWHELFSTSNDTVGVAYLMEKQEAMLRKNALSNFRTLLKNITVDQAMMIMLDNDPNSGTITDDDGNYILPNRNYAREFLQLFTLGPVLLNLDGTPIVDGAGIPIPTYTEEDVNEVARALTGWQVDWRKERFLKSYFIPEDHHVGPRNILGVNLPGRSGRNGALEVDDVVNVVMQHPNIAPFISKYLIQKLATERPSPAYVQRVATVFRQSKGDIKKVVRTILLDDEFYADANLRANYKEPIEHFVGAARALGATTDGAAFVEWTYLTKQLVYYPPSVFSFYPPGQKRQLINTATVTYRDRAADELSTSWWSVKWDAEAIINKNKLTTPALAVAWLENALLVGPMQPEVRQRIVDYFEGSVSKTKFRGAVWLFMTSPDYQRQ